MDIRTQSLLLAAIVGLGLGLSMLVRADRPRVLTLYSVFALTVGGYYLAHFFQGVFAASLHTGWWLRLAEGASLVLGALIPSAALGFFLEFLGVRPSAYRYGRPGALLSAIFGFAVGLSPLANSFWARVVLAAWVFSGLSASVSLLLYRMRQSDSRIERARLAYLAIGAAAWMGFAALAFLSPSGIPLPTLSPPAPPPPLSFLPP